VLPASSSLNFELLYVQLDELIDKQQCIPVEAYTKAGKVEENMASRGKIEVIPESPIINPLKEKAGHDFLLQRGIVVTRTEASIGEQPDMPVITVIFRGKGTSKWTLRGTREIETDLEITI
jgi:hypothetical protein